MPLPTLTLFENKSSAAIKRRLLSIIMLFSVTALLTLVMNRISGELFSAVSASKTFRKFGKAKRHSIPVTSKSSSASVAVEVPSDINRTASSFPHEQGTEMTAAPTPVEGHHRYAPSPGAEPHAHMSTNTSDTDGILCKMCKTNADCTVSKPMCENRRCVEDESEAALCVRNTHWECGDCKSNSDCHRGICRAGMCAESIQRFKICQSIISFYTGITSEGKQVDGDKSDKGGAVNEVVAEPRKVNTVVNVTAEAPMDARTEKKYEDNLKVKTKINDERIQLDGAVIADAGKAEAHASVGHEHVRTPSTNLKGHVGRGSDTSGTAYNGKDEGNWNVQGMAVNVKDKQPMQMDDRCSGSTTRSDTGKTCKQENVNRKRASQSAKAGKAKKSSKKLRRDTKAKIRRSEAHATSTDDEIVCSHDEDIVASPSIGHSDKTMKPTPLDTPGSENNKMADVDDEEEDGNDADDEHSDDSNKIEDGHASDDDDKASDDNEEDEKFYDSLDLKEIARRLSPEQWRELMRANGIPVSAASKGKRH